MDSPHLVQRLVDSFTALADEVQNLTDRNTILQHKIRYAHEQYQALADKYAPSATDVADIIAKLQIPPPTPTSSSFVPLPSRLHSDSSQAQLALFIREGKRVAQQLTNRANATHPSGSSHDTQSSTKMTSHVSTVLEKDFTVQGKKGKLHCPFSADKEEHALGLVDGVPNHQPHPPGDPICAAMLDDTPSATATNAAAQCPIRFMDKHSPEEIARYVETHKHELPRSHEVCLRRNQKNEDQIRKLDAKYGNLVSMIEDLSHLHAPMLPEAEHNEQGHVERDSDRRVSDWAENVGAIVRQSLTGQEDAEHDEIAVDDADDDRNGHFDRPLKEVRVGESPSRPWGISVPFPPDEPIRRSFSPPAPVRMPSSTPAQTTELSATKPSKCPFDHTKPRLDGPGRPSAPPPASASAPEPEPETPAAQPAKCPFDFTKMRLDGPGLAEFPKMDSEQKCPSRPTSTTQAEISSQPQPLPLKQPQPAPPDSPPPSHQPAFLNLASPTVKDGGGSSGVTVPQMVFNGPVFIGYPMDQAIQFMQHFQSQQQPQ